MSLHEFNSSSSLCFYEPDEAAWQAENPSHELHVILLWVCIITSCMSSFLSLHLIVKHVQHYQRPRYQRYIVRVLFMVPIYSILSCLSFRWAWKAPYFDVLRDAYEGFVLYSFFTLMLQYLGDGFIQQNQRLSHKPNQRLTIPLCCFKINPRGHGFLVNTRILVLQYAVVRFSTTVAAIVMSNYGILCPESMSWKRGNFWVMGFNMISASIAMYALVFMYEVIHPEIHSHQPLRKLLALKFVVFFSFWQGICLSMAVKFGWIQGTMGWASHEAMISSLQSLLVCCEMVIAASLHEWAFGWKKHQESRVQRWVKEREVAEVTYHPPTSRGQSETSVHHAVASLVDALNPVDVWKDVTTTPQTVADLRKYRKDKKQRRQVADLEQVFDADSLENLQQNGNPPLTKLLDNDLVEFQMNAKESIGIP